MAKPGTHGKDPQRCGAIIKKRRHLPGGDRYCRRWPTKIYGKCRLHGGKSTGPKTPEGKAKVVAAMVAGRKRWLEGLKAEGKKVPCGPKAKTWITKLKEDAAAAGPRRRRRKPYHPKRPRIFKGDDTPPALKPLKVAEAQAILKEYWKGFGIDYIPCPHGEKRWCTICS